MKIIYDGVIVDGEYRGWKIQIFDDRDGETGGYYLFFIDEMGDGFDYWFETERHLNAQLQDFNVIWNQVSS